MSVSSPKASGPKISKPKSSKPKSSKPESSKPENSKPESSKPNASRPKGSTAKRSKSARAAKRSHGASRTRSPAAAPVADVIRKAAAELSPAESRVAELVVRDPEAIAFGTVAEIAKQAGTSGPTVVRLADRLGYAGFVGLQAQVRDELASRLRPAVQRLRSRPGGRLLDRVLEAECDNVRRTLGALDDARFERALELLGDEGRRVWVLASEQSRAIASQLATELALVRDGVHRVGGSDFGVATRLAGVAKGDVVVAIDLRRHERWLLAAADFVSERGAVRIAVTDSELSPLCAKAECTLLVSAASAGPFDSHVGMLALFNALIGGLTARERRKVSRRIGALEAIWEETGVLLQD